MARFMRHYKKLALMCTTTMAIGGCSTVLRDAVSAGVMDFVTSTVSSTLGSLVPTGDIISQVLGAMLGGGGGG